MKRVLSIILAAALLLCLLPASALAAQTPAELGWSTDSNNFDGWTVENGAITCNYNTSATTRMWRSVESPNNFKISFDITCDNTTSPYIQLGGTVLEVDANNGNGNQVYPKVNGTGSDWLDAEGCQVNVQINRVNGGYLTVTLTGKGNSSPKVLTAACGDVDNIEIGMYRGGFMTLSNYKEEKGDESDVGDDPNAGSGDLGVEPSNRTSEVWDLGENWAVDADDSMLILTKATGGEARWNQTLDMNQSFTFSMDWVVNTVINSNNSWAEKLAICLKDEPTGDYLFIRLQRYRSGGGMYQVHIGAQWWTAATSSWSPNVLDVWASKMSGGVLKDMKVQIVRDNTQEALQIKLLDNEDGTSLGSAILKPANFSDATIRGKFSEKILSGTDVAVVIGCDGNNAPYYLSNPVLGEVEKVVSQNLFACDDVWKPELDESGNVRFATKNAGFGWMEYNTGLDVAAGLDFTYAVTVNDYGSEGASSAIRLRHSESPESYFFARLRFRDGQFALQGQLWNGDWTNLISTEWTSGATANDTWLIHVMASDGKLTLEVQDSSGKVLGTYTTDQMPAEFFSCENLELMFCTEGNGLHTLSNFKGLPEIYSADRRSEPFGKVVFAGDIVREWDSALLSDIAAYQNKTPETAAVDWGKEAILAEKGSLIILSDGVGAMLSGVSAEDYAGSLYDLIAGLKQDSSAGTVILVTGLPYIKGQDTELCAAYNAAIRAVAQEHNVLYANLYRAQSQTVWTLDTELNPSESGKLLAAGEVLQELLRSCSCLAVNSTTELTISATAPAEKTQAALEAFRAAADAGAMQKAVEDSHLGADLDLYLGFSTMVQQKVIEALLELDRSGIDSFEKADKVINAVSMKIGLENRREIWSGAPFTTYVAVGDSISYGETSVNKTTDGWVPLLASLISQAQGQPVTLINKAISGTRMCTVTDNKMFPAAKDTVQEYIVANNPDLITISYGINDLHAGTSLDEFITTYRGYLTEVTESCPNAVIIVCGLSAKGGDADSGTLKLWNAAIKSLAEEFGLIYNDSYNDTRGVEWLLSDGLHPTNAGYRVMANAAFRTLCAYVDLSGQYQSGDEIEPDPTVPDPTEPQTPSETPDQSVAPLLIGAAVVLIAAVAAVAFVIIRKKKKV